jgi:hypothetical protein
MNNMMMVMMMMIIIITRVVTEPLHVIRDPQCNGRRQAPANSGAQLAGTAA